MRQYKTMNKERYTEFIILTEMWQDGKYIEVSETIFEEDSLYENCLPEL